MVAEAELVGGSAEEIERRLAEWDRFAEQRVERYRAMRVAAEGIRVSESTSDGAVRVTVDHTGQLVEVATTAAVGRVDPERVGPLVLRTVQRAQAKLAGSVGDAMRATLGEDPIVARMVEQYQARFPQPVQDEVSAADPADYDFAPPEPDDGDVLGSVYAPY